VSLRFAVNAPGAPIAGDLEAPRKSQALRRFPAVATEALLARGDAGRGLQQLLAGGALAVTTGQQAGLFTGPLYAVHKALSAAALARALSARWHTPVVPVFWVAGDDHDFAEINHCTVLGADGKAARIVLRERPADAPMLPAYREPVGPEGALALGRIEELLPPSEFRADALGWLGRAYTGDRSMAEACAVALADLLAPYGVVVCRGWHGALKRAARGVLLEAARQAEQLDAALAAESQRLREAGREAPVGVGEGLSLLMLEGARGRDRLKIAGPGSFATRRGGEAHDVAALERILEEEPTRLSANVLLRPAVEAAVLPTVAYVGGAGELAYLAQARPVFELLGVPRPARVARLSGFVVEAKVDRVLERFALAPEDLARSDGELAARVAREDLPQDAVQALAALRASIGSGYAALQSATAAIDRSLEKPVENARNQALVGTQEIEKKLVAALRRGNDTALQQLARAREQLFPDAQPQERVLTMASVLSRHGAAAMEMLWAAAQAHAGLVLDAPPEQP
jgi:bacillithiol biosynthesis cysteine-adding enzyme BshC